MALAMGFAMGYLVSPTQGFIMGLAFFFVGLMIYRPYKRPADAARPETPNE